MKNHLSYLTKSLASFVYSLGFCLLTANHALAFDKHAEFMPWVLASLPQDVRDQLSKPLRAPCIDEDRQMYNQLREWIKLNPTRSFDESLKPTSPDCKKPITALEILSRGFVDDPDQGMDQNLPDSMDPENYRKWMGGNTGLGSQGFRHMYFGGWTLSHPIQTFQVPLYAVGEAPLRAAVMAEQASKLFANHNDAWAWRILSWELHYLQDLAQPFHSVQMISLGMIPWNPENFIKNTTRIVGNYHLAYEGVTLAELELGDKSPLKNCLIDLSHSATLPATPLDLEAGRLAHLVADASIRIAGPFGRNVMRFFGPQLKEPAVDLALQQGTPNYSFLAQTHSPEHQELDEMSCHAVANAVEISRRVILRAAH